MNEYKRLGDYIREVNVRNRDLKVTNLLGVNLSKQFFPSIANIIGTDLSKYKIIEKGQFGCKFMSVGRDGVLPISLKKDDVPAIISSAYCVFEVENKNILLPEYLMMWLCRPEFDRQLSFYAGGDVRGGVNYEDFCEMPIIIPSIERQREIVAEYETLTRRIRLNEQIIQNLETTAQTLYRKMFVDGIDKGNLPEGWRMGTLGDLVNIIDGDRGINYPKDIDLRTTGFCLFLNAGNVTSKGFNFEDKLYITEEKSDSMRAGKLNRGDIVFTTRGTVGNFALYSNEIPIKHMRINSGMVILRGNVSYSIQYVYHLCHSTSFKQDIINYLSGSAQPQLPIKDFNRIPIVIPVIDKLKVFSEKSCIVDKNIDILKNENTKLAELQSLLLTKMGK